MPNKTPFCKLCSLFLFPHPKRKQDKRYLLSQALYNQILKFYDQIKQFIHSYNNDANGWYLLTKLMHSSYISTFCIVIVYSGSHWQRLSLTDWLTDYDKFLLSSGVLQTFKVSLTKSDKTELLSLSDWKSHTGYQSLINWPSLTDWLRPTLNNTKHLLGMIAS